MKKGASRKDARYAKRFAAKKHCDDGKRKGQRRGGKEGRQTKKLISY